jgi:hypothetical protein
VQQARQTGMPSPRQSGPLCRRQRRTAGQSARGLVTYAPDICDLPGALQVLQGLLILLPEDDLRGIRNEVEHGRVPSNDAPTPFMHEYRVTVERRLKER